MGSEAGTVHEGRALVAGAATGPALVLDHGLSLAMGFDVVAGRITDVHSAYAGTLLVGRVLAMPVGRGSSSASTALAEAIRLGTAPAAIILSEVDEILAVGAIVARTLYGRICPIIVADPADFEAIRQGDIVTITADGSFRTAGVAPS